MPRKKTKKKTKKRTRRKEEAKATRKYPKTSQGMSASSTIGGSGGISNQR